MKKSTKKYFFFFFLNARVPSQKVTTKILYTHNHLHLKKNEEFIGDEIILVSNAHRQAKKILFESMIYTFFFTVVPKVKT